MATLGSVQNCFQTISYHSFSTSPTCSDNCKIIFIPWSGKTFEGENFHELMQNMVFVEKTLAKVQIRMHFVHNTTSIRK